MAAVESIYTAPVKSLGLAYPNTVQVGPQGIIEDRRLYLVGPAGELLTQRQVGSLVQVKADYQDAATWLSLGFPSGEKLEGELQTGAPVSTVIWGRSVSGRLVDGDWSQTLSDFCGQPVYLVMSDLPCQCYDEYPVSIISQASIDFLVTQGGGAVSFEAKRFRPNFLISGCEPHQEDGWIGSVIQIGPELLVRVVARDPRCAITTHNPETGEQDADTLRLILSYRPSARGPYFGVYGFIVRPGQVSPGDEVVTPVTG